MRLSPFLIAGCALAQSLQQAEQAHSRYDLAAEVKLLESVSGEDRAEAERRLAGLAWRFYKDDAKARAHFDAAEKLGTGLSQTLAARSRFERVRGRFDAARALARRAMEAAATNSDRNDARLAFAAATVEEAFGGAAPSAGEGLELVTEIVRAEPGWFGASRMMYALAVVVKDTARAEEALRSYYWGGKTFPLYPEAGLAGAPEEVVRYSRFCRAVRELVNEHYRLRALGKAEWTALRPAFLAEARKHYPGMASEDAFLRELRERFAARISFFRFGLEFGHVVVDTEMAFEQYGRKAKVRNIAVDSMISNGYVTWYSDGREIIGGWADDAVIRVRRDDALRAWAGLSNPEFERRIERLAAQDEETARKDPYAYLEGLSQRMWRRASRELLDELRAKGLAGAELRLAFLRQWQSEEDAHVAAHEARHLIDPPDAAYNREWTAALSRVIFGPRPAMGMRGIIAPNISRKDGGSGEANRRIMQDIVAWMEKHAAEIKGLDRTRPLLPQFDLLSNEQIGEAFRGMDPLRP